MFTLLLHLTPPIILFVAMIMVWLLDKKEVSYLIKSLISLSLLIGFIIFSLSALEGLGYSYIYSDKWNKSVDDKEFITPTNEVINNEEIEIKTNEEKLLETVEEHNKNLKDFSESF